MWKFLTAVAFATALQLAAPCSAASLRVAPVILDLSGPTATSNVRVWNDSKKPINVQVRIFRWSQEDGRDVYLPATDVVVSPPMTTLKAGAENIIRVVRTNKQRVRSEESYRLIVDELPPAGGRKTGVVMLVVRQSIPVFFSPETLEDAQIDWKARAVKGGYELFAHNLGSRRMKLSNVALSSGAKAIAGQNGLVGYVLGNSAARWFIPSTGQRQSAKSLRVTADTEAGPLDATVRLVKG